MVVQRRGGKAATDAAAKCGKSALQIFSYPSVARRSRAGRYQCLDNFTKGGDIDFYSLLSVQRPITFSLPISRCSLIILSTESVLHPSWNPRCIRGGIPLKHLHAHYWREFGHSARPHFAICESEWRYWFINAHLWIYDVCDQYLPINIAIFVSCTHVIVLN